MLTKLIDVRVNIAIALLANVMFAGSFAKAAQVDFVDLRYFASDCATKGEGIAQLERAAGAQVICLSGKIDNRMLNQAKEVVARGGVRHRPIVVANSGGGPGEPALELAELLGARGFDVAVADTCASSCANSLFLGARNKYILKGAQLGWHGSFPRTYAEFEAVFNAIPIEIRRTAKPQLSDEEYKADQWARFQSLRKRQQVLVGGAKAEAIMYKVADAVFCAENQRVVTPNLIWRPGISDFRKVFGVRNVYAESPDELSDPVLIKNGGAIEKTVDRSCLYAKAGQSTAN